MDINPHEDKSLVVQQPREDQHESMDVEKSMLYSTWVELLLLVLVAPLVVVVVVVGVGVVAVFFDAVFNVF